MEKIDKDKFFEKMEEVKGFVLNNNYKLKYIDDSKVIMEARVTETSLNPWNMCHGGFSFGLMDTCGGVMASITGHKVVTINASINYLRPCVGTKVKAVAKLKKIGKNIAYVEVELFDDKEVLVCNGMFTYFLKSKILD